MHVAIADYSTVLTALHVQNRRLMTYVAIRLCMAGIVYFISSRAKTLLLYIAIAI